MAGRRGGLVGRDGVLKLLCSAVEDLADAAESVPIQVAGEPGIGKTRLLAELSGEAQRRGHLALTGRAAEFELQLPFGVFIAALDDHLASLAIDDLGLAPPARSELATVFPALESWSTDFPSAVQNERYRTYRAVRTLLEELARAHPLVMVLDDVHWADPASAELLSHLLARPPRGPLLLAVAFRPAQVSPRLGTALSAAVRTGVSRRIDLSPLTPTEVDEVVGTDMSPVARDALYRESGGNPFYLEQLLRPRSAATRDREAFTIDHVPQAVAAALEEELVALPKPVRALLEAAAVAGDPFDADLVAAVAGIDEVDVWPGLDVLADRDLVRTTSVPTRFRFRHPIVRRAVYKATKPSTLATAHTRAAAALRGRGFAPATFAHHVERSATVGDEDLIAVLAAAGEATMHRAPATAAHWYECALRLVPDGDAWADRRLQLATALATALAGAGRLVDSRAALARVLRAPLPVDVRVGLTSWAAAVDTHLGRGREAFSGLHALLEQLEDQHSVEAARLRMALAETLSSTGDYLMSCEWARQALEGARTLDAHGLRVSAAAQVALDEFSLGRITIASTFLDEAVMVLDGLDDELLAANLHAIYMVTLVEAFQLERYDNAIRHAERGARLCRMTGRAQFLIPLLMAHSSALSARGQIGRAQEIAREAVEADRVNGNDYGLMATLVVMARTMADAGNHFGALAGAEEAYEISGRIDPGSFGPFCGITFGRALVAVGRAERAREVVIASSGGAQLPELSRFARCEAYAVLTDAELALGNVSAASWWAGEAQKLVEDSDLTGERATADRAYAALLLAQREFGCAAQVAIAAAERVERAGLRIDAGRLRLLAGRALGLAGQRDRAIDELERVESDMIACGAMGYREEAVAELQRLDRTRLRARSLKRAGMEALSEREREIAELVSEGKTNREIAEEMYLSLKTIERHISHIFDKLGVSTRAAVASMVASEALPSLQGGAG